jgi:hypothetical protein
MNAKIERKQVVKEVLRKSELTTLSSCHDDRLAREGV